MAVLVYFSAVRNSVCGLYTKKNHIATDSALSRDLPGFECRCWFIKKMKADNQRVMQTESN